MQVFLKVLGQKLHFHAHEQVSLPGDLQPAERLQWQAIYPSCQGIKHNKLL